MSSFLVSFVCLILIIAGTLGALFLFLPLLPVAWFGLLIFAWYHHFTRNLVIGLVVFGILVILSLLLDTFAPALAASGKKMSRAAMLGTVLGGLGGEFLLGPIGVLAGPFFGAFMGEFISEGNPQKAFRAGLSTVKGLILSSVFKLAIGISMLVYFIIITI